MEVHLRPPESVLFVAQGGSEIKGLMLPNNRILKQLIFAVIVSLVHSSYWKNISCQWFQGGSRLGIKQLSPGCCCFPGSCGFSDIFPIFSFSAKNFDFDLLSKLLTAESNVK